MLSYINLALNIVCLLLILANRLAIINTLKLISKNSESMLNFLKKLRGMEK